MSMEEFLSPEGLTRYAKKKGVAASVVKSLDGRTFGLFIPGENKEMVLEYESSSYEAIAVHIDILALSKK